MKKVIVLLVGIIGLIYIKNLIFPQKEGKKTELQTEVNRNNELIEWIKNNEPNVKDFVITDAHILYVAVKDDGTNRDGFAEYFCQIAKEKRSDVTSVKIIKYGSQNSKYRDNAYGILLGESRCR